MRRERAEANYSKLRQQIIFHRGALCRLFMPKPSKWYYTKVAEFLFMLDEMEVWIVRKSSQMLGNWTAR